MSRPLVDMLAQGETCMEFSGEGLAYMCTLPLGHEGDHVAEVPDEEWKFTVERVRWPRRSTAN